MNKTWVSAFGFIILMVTAVAWTAPVPDTGQMKCYNDKGDVITCPSLGQAIYGQNANYSINPISYTNYDYNTGGIRLSSPENGVTLNSLIPTLIYDTASDVGCKSANIYLGTVPHSSTFGGWSIVACRCSDKIVSWSNRIPSTTYYWQVEINGENYGLSDEWSFTTGSNGVILPAPVMISPKNDIYVSGEVIAEWQPVNGALQFQVNVRKEDGSGIAMITSDTTANITDWIDPGYHYEWFVQARNSYAWGTESVHEKFNTINNFFLSVTPQYQTVSKEAGTKSFRVSNTGTGTMHWTAAVTSGNSWLSITSGSSGSNSGTINCSFTANTDTSARAGTIRVTAPGATGSPVDVSVTQAAEITKCTATIDANLSMHIPLLSHLIPYWGAPSYTVDLVYAYNSSYPTMIIFKLTQVAVAQSGVYMCDPSTLADNFTIHIPDALLPDGITRMWLDLTYSQALSANGVCFYVSNYGVGSK